MTSLIVFTYIREQAINDTATTKNREGVFTLTSPRSSAPGTDRGTPAAIGSRGRGQGASDRVVPSRAILPKYIGGKGSLSG